MRSGYPSLTIDVKDGTPVVTEAVEENPLHVPFFPILAERGRVGQILDVNYTEAVAEFGEASFDYTSKYFQHPNLYARAAMTYGRVQLMRVATSTAVSGGHVLEARVIQGAPIVQYQRDANGLYVYGADGVTPIPLRAADGVTILTEPGVRVEYNTRPFAAGEVAGMITSRTMVDDDGNDVLILPIVDGGASSDSPGSYINYEGYRFYFDRTDDTDTMATTGSLFFRLAPVSKNPLDGTVSMIRNKFGDPSVYFSFDPDAFDANSERSMYFDDIMTAQFNEGALSFSLNVYADNVRQIGQMVYDLDAGNDLTLTSPYMVNIFTGVNWNNRPYEHLEVDTTSANSVLLTRDVVQFFQGGSDGDISKEALETMTRYYLDVDNMPEITDSARFPFTHLYDSGYNNETKRKMIALTATGVREDIAVDISTQDVALSPNDKAEDYSIGSSLRNYALLFPDSEYFATPAFRIRIYQQCGYLTGTTYTKIVPLTYDRLLKRLASQSSSRISAIIDSVSNGGAITAFRAISWVPNNEDTKFESWNIGLNYVQNYDKGAKWHYAGDRSIYPVNSSLLTDTWITDVIVYVKHIIRREWALLIGSHARPTVRFTMIKEAVESAVNKAFGTLIGISVTAHLEETVNGVKDGQVTIVEASIYGAQPDRQWKFRVPVSPFEE